MAVFETESATQPGTYLSLACYDDVSNCKELKQLVMSGKINATLLKTSMILDKFQVLAAGNQAIYHDRTDRRITKTLHSELLYCLSPNKNISDAFRRYGMAENDASVLVAEIHVAGQSEMESIRKHIKGHLMDIAEVSRLADEPLIKKIYKVSEVELTVGTLLDAVIMRMASKDFAV